MGVQESESTLEAERILAGSAMWAEAKEWGRLWQQRLERDHSRQRKMSCERQKEGARKRTFEEWSRGYHASTQQIFMSVHCVPCSRDAMVIMRDTRWSCKSWQGLAQTRPQRPYPEFYLKSDGKAAFEGFLNRGIMCWDLQCSKFPSCKANILQTGGEPGLHQPEQAKGKPLHTVWKRDDDCGLGGTDGDGEKRVDSRDNQGLKSPKLSVQGRSQWGRSQMGQENVVNVGIWGHTTSGPAAKQFCTGRQQWEPSGY